MPRVTAAFLALFLLLSASLYYVFDARPVLSEAGRVEVHIPEGASLSSIAATLYDKGVIRSPGAFRIAAKLMRRTRAFYPGNYTLRRGLSTVEAIRDLAHAKAAEITITIPEGLRSDEIVSLLCQKLSLDSLTMTALLTDSVLCALAGEEYRHLEGTLYPETYRFLENSDERIVLTKLVNHFRDNITADMLEKAQAMGFSEIELITFASLVEKETAREDERALVASVYHNRLEKDMLLNCDPTIIYMLVQRGEWDGNIRKKHFRIDDPYNSYMYKGLPPGPIANPGLASILASLNPAESDYLYFVGKNDNTGAHDFSKTLRQHINKVNRYQKRGQKR